MPENNIGNAERGGVDGQACHDAANGPQKQYRAPQPQVAWRESDGGRPPGHPSKIK
jgi:hypothetical protein